MAWLQKVKRKDGSLFFWIRDRRDGRQIVIPGGPKEPEATLKKEQYEIRRDLEKEGYDDQHETLLDQLWGKPQEVLKKTKHN
jgi:hypothetical protein